MADRATSRRPAIAPALAVLVGVVWLHDLAPARPLAAIALVSVAGAAALREPALRRALALVAFAGAGAASGAWTCEQAALRAAGWLPADGSATELDLVGTVLRAPERDRRGEFWLRAAVRPETDPSPGAQAATTRLVVRTSSEPSVVESLRRGDRIRVYARLRAARGADREAGEGMARLAWGVDATGSVKSARLVERFSVGRTGPLRVLDLLLAKARERLDRCLGADDDARHMAAAMLLGDRAGMDPGILRALRESGLFHLLAISGVNVAILVGAIFLVLRRLRLSRWFVLCFAVPSLWAFGVLVGADAPVTRACAGTVFALAGRAVGRDGDPLNTLAVIFAILALTDPPSVFHPGFQLTFAATAALVAAAGRVADSIPAPRAVAYALGASIAAYAATAPILAWHFGRLTPVGLVSNLAAGPLCAGILGAGCAALAAADSPFAGSSAARALRIAVGALEALARAAAETPMATIRVAKPSPGLLLAVVVLLLTAWTLSRRGSGRGARARWARAGAVAAILALHLGRPPFRPGSVEVAVIDVGQGQAVAVRSSGGQCLLIDGGGSGGGRFDTGERVVAPWIASWGCRRLDAVIATHAHDDHVGGLGSLLREFDTGSLWLAPGAWRDAAARGLGSLARERGIALVFAAAGTKRPIGGLDVEIVHPALDDAGLGINDRSAVVRVVTAEGATLLVPGDIERAGEERILSRRVDVAAQALVAAHHGAAGSSSDEWLDAVGASVAVVSAGEGNRFGHPSPATMARLRSKRVASFRTDRLGTIVLREEAGAWRVGDGPLRGRRRTAPE